MSDLLKLMVESMTAADWSDVGVSDGNAESMLKAALKAAEAEGYYLITLTPQMKVFQP